MFHIINIYIPQEIINIRYKFEGTSTLNILFIYEININLILPDCVHA